MILAIPIASPLWVVATVFLFHPQHLHGFAKIAFCVGTVLPWWAFVGVVFWARPARG